MSMRNLLLACGALALASPLFAVKCEVYPIPTEYHSGSGYTALEVGLDGNVYVGISRHGQHRQQCR